MSKLTHPHSSSIIVQLNILPHRFIKLYWNQGANHTGSCSAHKGRADQREQTLAFWKQCPSLASCGAKLAIQALTGAHCHGPQPSKEMEWEIPPLHSPPGPTAAKMAPAKSKPITFPHRFIKLDWNIELFCNKQQ